MDTIALDRFLTSEPSQLHYDRWLDKVLSHISEEDISSDDFNKDFDNFIEPLLLKLSTGGIGDGFIKPEFSAFVVKRRWWIMNKQREMKAYMERKKKFFEDNINWWNQII